MRNLVRILKFYLHLVLGFGLVFPVFYLDFLCCSYACCYTTYAITSWWLAGEFPTVWVSSVTCWMCIEYFGCKWFLMLSCALAVTWDQFQRYQQLVFILWTLSQGLLADYRCAFSLYSRVVICICFSFLFSPQALWFSLLLQQASLIPPPPTRLKRCATHCFVAQLIQYHEQIAKMNSFWPPPNRSGPFFGPRPPFNMGVVPPTDAASLLVNPMQGSYPVRAHAPLQESKAPTMASSPVQGGLSKDKAAPGNGAGSESNQRKHPPAPETQQSTLMPNMLVITCRKISLYLYGNFSCYF
jgi:hypothetical protein